ncbi:MAG: insulinase family protein, partial [Proteobacteria bacterium]|nr:insulinase family protein [Pseudomonadota bacterium]
MVQENIAIPFDQFTLENGLKVFLLQDNSLPIIAVNLWFDVGSKNEAPGRTGFAHLFEHLMF